MSKIQDTKETWNGKTYSEVEEFVKGELDSKAEKAKGHTNGNLAALDEAGGITDSGYGPEDFLTERRLKTINGQAVTGEGDITIPKGDDAVNPFKGWFDTEGSLRSACPEPAPGDYAYVKGAALSDPARIYGFSPADGWADSGRTVDTSGVQVFRTSEQVNEVGLADDFKDGGEADVAKASAITPIVSRMGEVELSETRLPHTPVAGLYVKAHDGSLAESAGLAYAEFEVGTAERVRFLGLKVKSTGFSSGYAFGYYEEGVWVTVRSYGWEVDKGMQEHTVREYSVNVPAGASHCRTLCATSAVSRLETQFYFYIQSGESLAGSLKSLSGKIYGDDTALDRVDAKKGGGVGEIWSTVGCAIASNGDWNAGGYSESNYIPLGPYIAAGFNRVRITAGESYAYYTFARDLLPASSLSAAGGKLRPYLSSLNGGEYRKAVPAGGTVLIDLPADTDAKYLYLVRKFASSQTVREPESVFMEVAAVCSGVLEEKDGIKDRLEQIDGCIRVVDTVEATAGRGEEFPSWIESHGNVSSGSNWQVAGTNSSYYIPLEPYMAAGFNRILVFPGHGGLSSYYTFSKKLFPEGSVVNGVDIYSYIADIGIGDSLRNRVRPEAAPAVIDLPAGTDAKYLYFTHTMNTVSGDYSPYSVLFQKTEKRGGIAESVKAAGALEIAAGRVPPGLRNVRVSPSGLEYSATALTSSRIYGDFACVLNSGYKINRALRVDCGGNVVDDALVTEAYPRSVMDGWSAAGRRTFGIYWEPLQYGVVLEITKEDATEPISAQEPVFRSFWRVDGSGGLASELETDPRYNGATHADSEIGSDRVYSQESVRAALKRAKTAAMIPWRPLRYAMPTSKDWRPFKYKAGSLQLGVPYSRSSVRDRWFGFNVSPYTFLTAAMNPYSVFYTEKIGDKADYPFDSEYGLSGYGSGHGIPYYGLVCSAFGSFVYGFSCPVDTDGFIQDTGEEGRNYVVSRHKESGNAFTNAPVSVYDIPSFSVVTTPAHTYMVLDFLKADGARVAAVVAEETSPNVKVGLYPIERLQARFDAEYSYYCTSYQNTDGTTHKAESIEVTVVKPSVLDGNKTVNMWDVNGLYPIDPQDRLGGCEPVVDVDKDIMFYMGDRAVVMEYDADNYVLNDRCWLIVRPGDVFTKIAVEKWDRASDSWVLLTGADSLGRDDMLQYSEGNQEYYKVDVTGLCRLAGKYRACLANDDGSVSSGYTQWIVLNGEIYRDSSDSDKVKWESGNSGADSEEYAVAVSAAPVLSNGGGTAARNGEMYARQGYIPSEALGNYEYISVDFRCAWGTGMRKVKKSQLQTR